MSAAAAARCDWVRSQFTVMDIEYEERRIRHHGTRRVCNQCVNDHVNQPKTYAVSTTVSNLIKHFRVHPALLTAYTQRYPITVDEDFDESDRMDTSPLITSHNDHNGSYRHPHSKKLYWVLAVTCSTLIILLFPIVELIEIDTYAVSHHPIVNTELRKFDNRIYFNLSGLEEISSGLLDCGPFNAFVPPSNDSSNPAPIEAGDSVWIYYVPDEKSMFRYRHYHCWYASLLANASCRVRFFLDRCIVNNHNAICQFQPNTVIWLNAHSELSEVNSLAITKQLPFPNDTIPSPNLLVHNNDETGVDGQFSTAYSRFEAVSRAYYRAYSSMKHVHWHPLGHRGPLINVNKNMINNRSIICGFAGERDRADRGKMIASITSNVELNDWCHIEVVTFDQRNYIDWLHRIVFCLSPAGNNDECYRFYECLEYGAIPIILESYVYVPALRQLSNNNSLPFVVIPSWNDLHSALNHFRHVNSNSWDWQKISDTQQRVTNWYTAFKKQAAQSMQNAVCGLIEQ